MLSAGRGCELVITTHVKSTWKKFRELLPVLTSSHLSYKTHGHVYMPCSMPVKLGHWPRQTCSACMAINDRAMISQICNIKPEDLTTVRSKELLAKLELEDHDLSLRGRRLHWFGHVELSSGAVGTA